MKQNHYSLVESVKNGVRMYGIRIVTQNGSVSEYDGISPFAEDADELIRQMSQDYISPVHFNDIVTDYLVRLSMKKQASIH